MTELVRNSTEQSQDATACVVSLLHHYGFDLGGYTISQLLLDWQKHYPATWMRLATIEALYQGRYKAISVEQILAMWQRRSQPIYHFNHEFERLVCDKLPEHLVLLESLFQSEPPAPRLTALETKRPDHHAALQLPTFDGTALPESPVMLALRTLHSDEMAALTEAQNVAEADEQAPMQSYSYNLRSDELPSGESSQNHEALPAQIELDQTAQPTEAVDATMPPVNDDLLQNEPIAPQPPPLEPEQSFNGNQVTSPGVLALPPGDTQALSSLAPVGAIAKILQQLDHQESTAKTAFPGLGLLVPALKPKHQFHLTTHYQPIWLTAASSKQPIHQFTPAPDLPDFYTRLKTVAQSPDDQEDSTLSQ